MQKIKTPPSKVNDAVNTILSNSVIMVVGRALTALDLWRYEMNRRTCARPLKIFRRSLPL